MQWKTLKQHWNAKFMNWEFGGNIHSGTNFASSKEKFEK